MLVDHSVDVPAIRATSKLSMPLAIISLMAVCRSEFITTVEGGSVASTATLNGFFHESLFQR
jgi:hypothetical protein